MLGNRLWNFTKTHVVLCHIKKPSPYFLLLFGEGGAIIAIICNYLLWFWWKNWMICSIALFIGFWLLFLLFVHRYLLSFYIHYYFYNLLLHTIFSIFHYYYLLLFLFHSIIFYYLRIILLFKPSFGQWLVIILILFIILAIMVVFYPWIWWFLIKSSCHSRVTLLFTVIWLWF